MTHFFLTRRSTESALARPAMLALLSIAIFASPADRAFAQAPAGEAFAIVVGTDVGGPGQERLRYAESDAVRMRDTLVAVGGYASGNVTLLRHPRIADVERALSAVRSAVAERHRRGLPSQLVFYYSGHARSQGLHLGGEELRLVRLRDAIASVSADFTLVLLDACQSGAYSRARGVEPASSFSFNSAAELRTRGIALMASSSDDELSQESETLRGGFYTHHLVVGLRGGADVDHDGRVTLDEAYRYTYERTLSDTARTAIGGQHVSLETDLEGRGGVPLSYPERASVHLVLPPSVSGTVLVEHVRSATVVAEVEKASGDTVRLALVEGRYRILVRSAGKLHECDLALRTGQSVALDLTGCRERDPAREVRSRGNPGADARAPWGFELGMGLSSVHRDAYAETLADFGFTRPMDFRATGRGSFVVERRLPRWASLVLRVQTFDHPYYSRDRNGGTDATSPVDEFEYTTFGFALGVRATGLFADGKLGLYGELAAGPGLGVTRFRSGNASTDRQTDVGYTLGLTGGCRWMPWQRFGFYAELGFNYAPIVENLLGQTHDSGGITGLFGLRMETHP